MTVPAVVPSRKFVGSSALVPDRLGLALSPALTPAGLDPTPSFFHGFAAHPQVLSRGLLALADVTATRYFQYRPEALRDPVLTANGDRLRAECFSACNGVYARLDLLGAGFDGGEIGYGTTNVDIGPALRSSLSNLARHELFHLDVGLEGLAVSTLDDSRFERKVEMPDRWVRALGNAAELHQTMTRRLTIGGHQAQQFLTTVPNIGRTDVSGWLTPDRSGLRLGARPSAESVFVAGLHRLNAAKRLLPHVQGLTVYGPAEQRPGPIVFEWRLPGSRLILGLTDEAWRGHSGEGSLLAGLVTPTQSDDVESVAAALSFQPAVDVVGLAEMAGLPEEAVLRCLAVLASSGRVGWDLHDGRYFHRELPLDPDRVTADNPRLVAARRLVEDGLVVRKGDGWAVLSRDTEYRVRLEPDRCTCTWFLRHAGYRGPCKHLLAVHLGAGAGAGVGGADQRSPS